jgi:hypothetical protein
MYTIWETFCWVTRIGRPVSCAIASGVKMTYYNLKFPRFKPQNESANAVEDLSTLAPIFLSVNVYRARV